MALFFNLKVLEEQSCDNPTSFMSMLYYHWNKDIRLTKDNRFKRSKVPLVGHSYLLNPADLFKDTTDTLFKVQYVKLAGVRDYSLYKQYKYSGLQKSFFPDLIEANIKHNPLLIIKPTEILFKYEQ